MAAGRLPVSRCRENEHGPNGGNICVEHPSLSRAREANVSRLIAFILRLLLPSTIHRRKSSSSFSRKTGRTICDRKGEEEKSERDATTWLAALFSRKETTVRAEERKREGVVRSLLSGRIISKDDSGTLLPVRLFSTDKTRRT